MQRCAFLRAGFGPEKGTIGKVEGSKTARRGNFDAAGLCAERMPVKAAGDHEMEDQPETVFETDADAFAEAAELEDFFAGGVRYWRARCAQEEGTDDADRFESLAQNARFEGFDVNGDIGEFRHASPSSNGVDSREKHRTTAREGLDGPGARAFEECSQDRLRTSAHASVAQAARSWAARCTTGCVKREKLARTARRDSENFS